VKLHSTKISILSELSRGRLGAHPTHLADRCLIRQVNTKYQGRSYEITAHGREVLADTLEDLRMKKGCQ